MKSRRRLHVGGYKLYGDPTGAGLGSDTAPFYFNCPAVETNCYRGPVVVNNAESDGAERVDVSWISGALSSGISRAGELVSPGQ